MKPSLRFVSLLLLIGLNFACSSKLSNGSSPLPPIIKAESYSQKYNLQLDFIKHHFSGLLMVRRMPDHEIRILASTYFGLSLFDFSFQGDTFKINSCIEPMRKEKILNLLEMDFRNLFLSSKDIRMKEKSSTFEKRINGSGLGKSVFTLSAFANGQPEQVKIKHPWIRLSIQLDKLNENNP